MPSGKASKAGRRVARLSRGLPNTKLVKQTQLGAANAMTEARKQVAAMFEQYPLPKDEGTALRYMVRTRYEAELKTATAKIQIAEYVRRPELLQTASQKRDAEEVLLAYLANQRRLEIIDSVQARKGTLVEKLQLLQKELMKAVLSMAAGYTFEPFKAQLGPDDAYSVLAGLLLSNLRWMPSVEQAAQDVAPGENQPMLYAALLAIAEGQPDAANIEDFHAVFAQARKSLDGLRKHHDKTLVDNDMVQDLAVDNDNDPAQLLMAEFERDEQSRLHDERREFLGLLTSIQRTVLLLDAEGLSRREIAERLHLGEETIKTHLSAARKHVRDYEETGKKPRVKNRTK